jgi:hypothetical protein
LCFPIFFLHTLAAAALVAHTSSEFSTGHTFLCAPKSKIIRKKEKSNFQKKQPNKREKEKDKEGTIFVGAHREGQSEL